MLHVNRVGTFFHFYFPKMLQKVIERFPASLIEDPTAFTSDTPLDMYNNVLVFIVGGGSGARSEMHIFQVSLLQRKIKLTIRFDAMFY